MFGHKSLEGIPNQRNVSWMNFCFGFKIFVNILSHFVFVNVWYVFVSKTVFDKLQILSDAEMGETSNQEQNVFEQG
jgi:hypothetical protein